MRKFNITVNGKAYEVEVEEIGTAGMPVSRPQARTAAPVAPAAPVASAPAAAPAPAPAAAAPVAAPVAGSGEVVNAPMPGTILDIKVAVGDSVASGNVLCILEAMKMENEIMAPTAGKIVSIHVTKGASVNSGDVLIVIG